LATITVVNGDSLDHFAVSLEEPTIAFTETSKIFVVAKDRDSNDVALADDALLQFSIDSTAYGSFIRANGDTVPSPLSNVLYSDGRVGNIRFAAVNKNPDSLVSFRVIARLQADTTKSGDTTLVLLEQTLKIVMSEPREVRPSIPSEDRDTSKTKLRKKPFEVNMTRGGKVVPNHLFRVWTNYVKESGGHDHDSTRGVVRDDTHDNYGYFTVGQSTAQRRPLDGVIAADGKFSAIYNASIWGDSVKIYLESRNNPLLRDSLRVIERVAALIDVPANANYLLRGQTSAHHDNHYIGSQTALDSLTKAAVSFQKQDWNTTGKLRLNDISLPYGGGFDISGKWNPDVESGGLGHKSHRAGRNIDIENLVLIDTVVTIENKETEQQEQKTVRIADVDWVKKFKEFMIEYKWAFFDEGQTKTDIEKRTRRFPHFDWKGN
jgi:hypothetical protein